MNKNGFSPIILIIVVGVIVLAVGAVLFSRSDSATTIIQPNGQKSLYTRSDPVYENKILPPEVGAQKKDLTVEVKAKSAKQVSVIDENGGVTYTNETFHFSLRHPKSYVFDEKIRNYYGIDSTDDPSELVYSYFLSNPQVSQTGGLPGDKIIITVYQKGYEPQLEADPDSALTPIKVGGQETNKSITKEGTFINVGPLIFEDNKYIIQYTMPSALSDQTFFNAVIESFKFIK